LPWRDIWHRSKAPIWAKLAISESRVFARPTAAAVLVLALTAAGPAPSPAPSPVGRWLTENGNGVIEIAPCGSALCGRIAGIEVDHPDDPMPHDWRGRSQCGLAIITGAVWSGDGWRGDIIDPRDGASYHATLKVDAAGQLRLRGYVLVPLLGSTQVWTRYDEPLPSDCRLPASRTATHGAPAAG
jgi:uncharacterized protein (DUF2147 family)